jgi:hypothetical protein
MPQLIERLQNVEVMEPQEASGLQVFGLRWQPGADLGYRTLDEALAEKLLEVTEVNDGGSVPTLKVHNKGDRMTFLMAGEHLQGGKQNRVLNASLMVAAETELPIPVSCVERGRWAYRAGHFVGSGSASHSKLRKLMHSHATESYRKGGTPMSKQGEVWQEVDRKLMETHSSSPTAHLDQAYADSAPTLGDILGQLAVPEGASGVVFAYGGQIVGFDLFDQPATLGKLWAKLVRAYGIDAVYAPQEGPKVSREQVLSWLHGAAGAKEETFKSPGVGNDVRMESATLVGAGLLVEEQPVHVEVFASGGMSA